MKIQYFLLLSELRPSLLDTPVTTVCTKAVENKLLTSETKYCGEFLVVSRLLKAKDSKDVFVIKTQLAIKTQLK